MVYNLNEHHRRSIRLKGYDYSLPGAYFVTIVTKNRACLFGEIVDDEMRLNRAGKIAQWEWRRLGQRFPNVQVGTFVVMPNHIHGILIIGVDVRATLPGQTKRPASKNTTPTDALSDNSGSPLPDDIGQSPLPRPHGPAPGSLGAIIGQFKSRVTKRLWAQPGLSGNPVWQRNYYERIIRNDIQWNIVRNYILNNPLNWKSDREFNENAG